MNGSMIEAVERWAVRGTRVGPGEVSAPERVATGLLGLGLLMMSRSHSAWRIPAAVAGGAALARAVTGECPVYAARQGRTLTTAERLSGAKGTHIRERVVIAQPIGEVFAFWRALTPLGTATGQRLSVVALDERRSLWSVRSRAGAEPLVEWTAELINEVPQRVLGWRTIGTPDVVSAGSVTFTETAGGGGTDVRIHLQYAPPLGWIGTAAAAASGHAPGAVVRAALADIKRYLERGRAVVPFP